MQLKLAFGLALAVLFVVVAFQNLDPVVLRFLKWQTGPIPLMIVIMGSAVMGAIFMAMIHLTREWKLRRKIRQKDKELETLKSTQSDFYEPKP